MLDAGVQNEERENIHDLPNLFGIVSSARDLPEDKPSPKKRPMLLDAISETAPHEGMVTSALRTKEIIPMACMFDLNQHLGTLQSLLDTQAGDRAQVVIRTSEEKSLVKVDALALDAALAELVANTRAVLPTAGRIILRTKRVGRRLWVTVAGAREGMSQQARAAVLTGAHSSDLGRVRHFVQGCHAKFRLRSAAGRGTVAVLMIPLVLNVGFSRQVRSPARAGRQVRTPAPRGWGGKARRVQPTRSDAYMDSQPGEPRPDIIEPSAPPETPVPHEPREMPIPNGPEIIPSQPDFVPGAPPEEYPASL